MSRNALPLLLALAATGLGCANLRQASEPLNSEPGLARGTVFSDDNGNRQRDPGEAGIAGVRVSNGQQVVTTDRKGRYELPVDLDAVIFVIKPSGWATPIDGRNLPRFYYLHKPAGSPAQLEYPTVSPTGPLPASIDFPLKRQQETSPFRVLIVGDPQPADLFEVGFFIRDIVEELPEHDAAFGISLGDLVSDDLALLDPLTQALGLVGIPWYNVIGNHDLNLAAENDRTSDETFERLFGPSTYAFAYANVHFIVLDNVYFHPESEAEDRPDGYEGALLPRQLQFIREYIGSLPEDQLVVLMMHIPIVGRTFHELPQRGELFEILADHPRAFSISAHSHTQEHFFLGEDAGNEGPIHHHWNSPTASGSWWRGSRDEMGIPHTTMRDGSPNGYSIATFDGAEYSIRFKAARRPASYQMNIEAPERVDRAESIPVTANIFAGGERSIVELRVIKSTEHVGGWIAMSRVAERDPSYRRQRNWEAQSRKEGSDLPGPNMSPHLWRASVPGDLVPGSYWLEVRSRDMFDRVDLGRRVIQILPGS